MVTFAVIGRDDGMLLPNALRDVCEAARPGDHVLYVDGDSSDGSGAIARARGIEVLSAPRGKGRSMQIALLRAETPYVCFFDADLERSERNIAGVLREAVERDPAAAMIVADIAQPLRKVVVIRRLYGRFIRFLFPEAHRAAGRGAMSGFRVVATEAHRAELPPGYGVEAHLNVALIMDGGHVKSVEAGEYEGPTREYANAAEIGIDVTRALLDAAEAHGRLAPELRARWEAWAAPFLDLARRSAREPERWREINERARDLAARPLPVARAPVVH